MNDIRDLEEFHFRGQQGMYFSEYLSFDDFVCLFSNTVEDNYWNYAAWVTLDFGRAWPHLRYLFRERNRVPSIYVSKTSGLYGKVEHILPPSFYKAYSDAWMILVDEATLSKYSVSPKIAIERINPLSQGDEFVGVFDTAYKGDSPDDPYGNLPAYYAKALRNSFQLHPAGYTVEHYLAKVDGTPAGVATAIMGNAIVGVYNVGTIRGYRKQGVGIALMAHIYRKCADKSISTIILQTEQGSPVEKWYTNMGFQTVSVASCYSEKAE